MIKIVFRVLDKDYNCVGGYSYLSKVNDNSSNRQKAGQRTYIMSTIKNLHARYENSYEVFVDYVDCV